MRRITDGREIGGAEGVLLGGDGPAWFDDPRGLAKFLDGGDDVIVAGGYQRNRVAGRGATRWQSEMAVSADRFCAGFPRVLRLKRKSVG